MKALLLIAHGSRRASSNEEVVRLAEHVSSLDGNDFDIVEPAFLEIAEPDIVAGIARCVEQGATRVTVIPYFLSAGRHVVEDIPDALSRARERFPDVLIESGPHLGAADVMPEMVLSAALSIDMRG